MSQLTPATSASEPAGSERVTDSVLDAWARAVAAAPDQVFLDFTARPGTGFVLGSLIDERFLARGGDRGLRSTDGARRSAVA
jgi:hypothetical protein